MVAVVTELTCIAERHDTTVFQDNQQLNEEKRELQAAVDKLMQKLHEADRENQSLLIINDQLRQWAGQAWLQ